MRPAVLAGTILLASVCSSQVDERCPGTALERGPQLLSRLDQLKDASRQEGIEGRVVFRLTVTETGAVRDLVLEHPAARANKIEAEILKLRFCPAVKLSRYAETRAVFDIQLK